MNFMKGYLSYTLAALAVLGGISGWLMGSLDNNAAMSVIWAGLAVFGIRRAL